MEITITGLGELPRPETSHRLILSTQQGGRIEELTKEDSITVELPDGQRLTGAALDTCYTGEPDQPPSGALLQERAKQTT